MKRGGGGATAGMVILYLALPILSRGIVPRIYCRAPVNTLSYSIPGLNKLPSCLR